MKKVLSALAVLALALGFGVLATPASAVNPTLNIYVSAPIVQNTFVTGADVVTFNSTSSPNQYPTGACPSDWKSSASTVIGSVTSTPLSNCQIKAADAYGGASSSQDAPNGTPITRNQGNSFRTQYASVSSNKSITVTLARAETYLGFWWAAGDNTNSIQLYSGTDLVGTFTTANLLTMLNHGTGNITAMDGTTQYAACEYFKNPVNTASPCPSSVGGSDEPFAYVHLVGSNGLSFDKIVFSQGNTGGFEFDNVAIANTTVSLPTTVVSLPPSLLAGNSTQTATTCTSFSSNIDWTASNFLSTPSYSVSPTLPAGLSLDATTGEVSGSASAASGSTTYTMTASAGAQSASATFSLAVTDSGNLPCTTPTPTPTSTLASTAAPVILNSTPLLGVGALMVGVLLLACAAAVRRKQ